MKVYAVIEETKDEIGFDETRVDLFDTKEKTNEYLLKREKELYRNYDVEEALKRYEGEYIKDEPMMSYSFVSAYGEYHICGVEKEVQ